jgi:hypothetical protein
LIAMTEKLEAPLAAVADALAELPGKDIVFEWLRGGRLADEVDLILEERHPEKAAEAERAFTAWKNERRARKR